MVIRIAFRLCLILTPIISAICLLMMWIGSSIPTTRVVAYLYHLNANRHSFGISDIHRRLAVYVPVPFESEWDVFFSPDGKRALMTLDFYSQVEFYMLDLNTYQLVRFPLGYNTCAPPRETIQWSPNSRHVSFHCRPNTLDSQLNGLHIWDTHTNSIQRLHNPSHLQVMPYTWSPNGSHISFVDNHVVWLSSLTSNQTDVILNTASNYLYMTWSPDGKKLAIGKADRLSVYDVETQHIVTAPLLSTAMSVFWSHNSQWLAMIVQNSGFYTIKTWDMTNNLLYDIGTNRHPMNSVVDLDWSDDDEWLVVQEDINQATRLAKILITHRDGSQAYRVVSDGRYPRWIPNSQIITYYITQIEQLRYGRDLVMVSLDHILSDAIKPRLLVRDVLSYAWLPDGQLLSLRSIDRYGRARQLRLIPAGNDRGWSLFPAGYTVSTFAIWR